MVDNKNRDIQEEEMVVTLEMEDENGEVKEIQTSVIGVYDIEYKGEKKDYIALSPLEQKEDEEYDVWIFRYVENPAEGDEEETFDIIEIQDDEEYEAAVVGFDQVMEALGE